MFFFFIIFWYSQHPCKIIQAWWYIFVNPVLRRQRPDNLWACWIGNLAKQVSTRFRERPCLMESNGRRHWTLASVLCIPVHTHTHTTSHGKHDHTILHRRTGSSGEAEILSLFFLSCYSLNRTWQSHPCGMCGGVDAFLNKACFLWSFNSGSGL